MLTGLQAIFFYIFAFIAVSSAVMVITARNPVHSVLFLILTFFNASALFLLTGAEFLAMILLIVYVGAVAVLFLFVVMMLDVDFKELKKDALRYAPIGGLVGFILASELIIVLSGSIFEPKVPHALGSPTPDITVRSNTAALGDLLYTDYVFYFQLSGMILLVAMIGAIILTLRHKPNVKRQNISHQVARSPQTSIEIKQVETGKGI